MWVPEKGELRPLEGEDFNSFFKRLEDSYPNQRQVACLKLLCLFFQREHRVLVVGTGMITEEEYKDVFLTQEDETELLWELQGKFVKGEVFNQMRDVTLRQLLVTVFRRLKSGETDFDTYHVGREIIEDCCHQSGIPKQITSSFFDLVFEELEQLNKIGEIPEQVVKEFFGRFDSIYLGPRKSKIFGWFQKRLG